MCHSYLKQRNAKLADINSGLFTKTKIGLVKVEKIEERIKAYK